MGGPAWWVEHRNRSRYAWHVSRMVAFYCRGIPHFAGTIVRRASVRAAVRRAVRRVRR